MLSKAVVLVAFAITACASAPESSQMPAIAAGVRVANVPVGGLTSEPARARVAAELARPVRVVFGKRTWWAPPRELGAGAEVDRAISEAFDADTGERVALPVNWSPELLRTFVARVALGVDRRALDARLVGVGRKGQPLIREAVPGKLVRRRILERRLERTLRDGRRAAVKAPVRVLQPKVRRKTFGPVIVITRGANTLRLFRSTKLVRTFRVATGQASYPTPSGSFRIVVKQLNPWWIPPDSDWARGLKPIPPGPGNPLGTRWMGLSVNGVGIHGTPDAASIGYSASHGCIRMQISDAEWLFQHVGVGTPVWIV